MPEEINPCRSTPNGAKTEKEPEADDTEVGKLLGAATASSTSRIAIERRKPPESGRMRTPS